MADDILEKLDTETKEKVQALAKEKSWSENLAAIAVMSGAPGAAAIIDSALTAAQASAAAAAEKAESDKRAKLREEIVLAEKAGDYRKSIALKNRLFGI